MLVLDGGTGYLMLAMVAVAVGLMLSGAPDAGNVKSRRQPCALSDATKALPDWEALRIAVQEDAGVDAAAARLLKSSCFDLMQWDAQLTIPSGQALRAWWYDGGDQFLKSYLEPWSRVVVFPPDPVPFKGTYQRVANRAVRRMRFWIEAHQSSDQSRVDNYLPCDGLVDKALPEQKYAAWYSCIHFHRVFGMWAPDDIRLENTSTLWVMFFGSPHRRSPCTTVTALSLGNGSALLRGECSRLGGEGISRHSWNLAASTTYGLTPQLMTDLWWVGNAFHRRPLLRRNLPQGMARSLSGPTSRAKAELFLPGSTLSSENDCEGVTWYARGNSLLPERGQLDCPGGMIPGDRSANYAGMQVAEDLQLLHSRAEAVCLRDDQLPPQELLTHPSLTPRQRTMLNSMIRDHKIACKKPGAPKHIRID